MNAKLTFIYLLVLVLILYNIINSECFLLICKQCVTLFFNMFYSYSVSFSCLVYSITTSDYAQLFSKIYEN